MRILWLGWEDGYASSRVREAADSQGISLECKEVFDTYLAVDERGASIFTDGHDLLDRYDALVVRTFFPYISEALTAARLFSEAGKIVIDQSLTDEGYAISKMHDYVVLARGGIPVPRTYQMYDLGQVEEAANRLGYPCVLKGIHGAQGSHVYMIDSAGQLRGRVRRYPCGELVLQEFLPAEEDYRVIVIGFKALPGIVSRRPPPEDFRTNLAVGGRFCQRRPSEFPELGPLAEKAARVLRREFASVDIRLKDGRPLVLEVNRAPDFKGFERATNHDVAGEFVAYVRRRLAGESP